MTLRDGRGNCNYNGQAELLRVDSLLVSFTAPFKLPEAARNHSTADAFSDRRVLFGCATRKESSNALPQSFGDRLAHLITPTLHAIRADEFYIRSVHKSSLASCQKAKVQFSLGGGSTHKLSPPSPKLKRLPAVLSIYDVFPSVRHRGFLCWLSQ